MSHRLAATLGLLLLAGNAIAAPNVSQLDIRGLQIGGTTRIRVTGSDLSQNPRLVSTIAFQQTVVGKAAANAVSFDVRIAKNVSPGIYNFWLVTETGVSQKVLVAVDALPQKPLAKELTVPISAHGQINGSQRATTTFAGKKGQVVMVAVEAQRLGSRLRPVLQLFDSNNRLLSWTLPKDRFRGDARIRVRLPHDGKYRVELNDLEYAAPAPGFFRLKIGSWQLTDLVYPPIVTRGKPSQVAVIGTGKQVSFSAAASASLQPVAVGPNASGPQAFVAVTNRPVTVEPLQRASSTKPLPMAPSPSVACGRILAAKEVDTWQVPVAAGQRFRIRLAAQSLGSPLDGFLTVRSAQGKSLGTNDDAAGQADSQLDVTVPKDSKWLFIDVGDRHRLGGTHFVYHLSVEPVSAAPSDFSLRVDNFRLPVASGDRTVFRVLADRVRYRGPIDLAFSSLPAGVQAQTPRIPAGEDGVLVTLNGAGHKAAAVVTKLVGVATIGGKRVERLAADKTQPRGDLQPWLSEDMLVSLGSPPTPAFDAAWSRARGEAIQLVLGGEALFHIRGFRPLGSDGAIRLSLFSSQRPVLNNKRQLVAANMVRLARGNEIAASKPAQVAFDAIAPLRVTADKAKSVAATLQADLAKRDATIKRESAKSAQLVKAAQMPLLQLQPKVTAAVVAAETQARIHERLAAIINKVRTDSQAQVAAAELRYSQASNVGPAESLALAELNNQVASLQSQIQRTKDPKSRGILQGRLSTLIKETQQLDIVLVGAEQELAIAKAVLSSVRELAAVTSKQAQTQLAAAAKKEAELKKAADQRLSQLSALKASYLAVVKRDQQAKKMASVARVALLKQVTAASAASKAAQTKLDSALGKAVQAARLAPQETAAVVAVPPSLAQGSYMLTMQAQLLSRDKKRVLATKTLPVRYLEVIRPFSVRVDKAQWSTKLAAGKVTVATLTGKVKRQGGFNGTVTISASGLPKGVKAAGVAAAGKETFTLNITFNKNQKPTKLNLQIFGTGRFTNKLPVVRSPSVPVTLQLAK